jgi:hypothetical protein
MKLFKRVPFLDELLVKCRVLIKPYTIGRKVKIELNNTYIVELSYSEAIEAQKQLNEAICKLAQKDKKGRVDSTAIDQQLTDESINNTVSSWSHLEFHQPRLLAMCKNASKDREQNMISLKAHPEHPLFEASLDAINQGLLEDQLKYLVVHGYTGEYIYNQAGINK